MTKREEVKRMISESYDLIGGGKDNETKKYFDSGKRY